MSRGVCAASELTEEQVRATVLGAADRAVLVGQAGAGAARRRRCAASSRDAERRRIRGACRRITMKPRFSEIMLLCGFYHTVSYPRETDWPCRWRRQAARFPR